MRSPNIRHLPAVVIVLPVVLAVSALTHRALERPFLELRHVYVR